MYQKRHQKKTSKKDTRNTIKKTLKETPKQMIPKKDTKKDTKISEFRRTRDFRRTQTDTAIGDRPAENSSGAVRRAGRRTKTPKNPYLFP